MNFDFDYINNNEKHKKKKKDWVTKAKFWLSSRPWIAKTLQGLRYLVSFLLSIWAYKIIYYWRASLQITIVNLLLTFSLAHYYFYFTRLFLEKITTFTLSWENFLKSLREKIFLVEEEKFYPIIRGENWQFSSLGKTRLVKLEGQFLLENGCQINFACSFPHHYLPYVVETSDSLSLTNTHFKNKAGFTFFKSLIGINYLFTFILFTSFMVYHVWVLGMDNVKELREEIERKKEEKAQEALEKENTLKPTLPENIPYSFADIGGYEEVKNELANAARIIKEGLSIRTPRGFVLYGPPGTGKTMIAEAFAKESGLPFFSTNGEFLRAGKFREMMQMSANKVISVFNGAVKYSQEKGTRVILFIDEIDDMDQEYPRGEGGKELRKVMGGGEKTQKYDNVIVICTTNSIDWFHKSILRWKRLEEQFKIGCPNEKELSCIIDLYINKNKGNIKEELDKKKLRNKILEKVKDLGFTGASVSRLFELLDYTALNLRGKEGESWDWPVFEKTIENMKKHGAMNVE